MLEILQGPKRVVCLTEETTEWLYLLGEEARIVHRLVTPWSQAHG